MFVSVSLAQLVEHVTFNDVADGSNPSRDTIANLFANFINHNTWLHHLMVRIQGFHPCHRGSNPLGVTTSFTKNYSHENIYYKPTNSRDFDT